MGKGTNLAEPTRRPSEDRKSSIGGGLRIVASRLVQNRARLILNCVCALLAGGFSYLITGLLPFYPVGWQWPVVLATVLLWMIKPDIGVAFSLTATLLPVAYNSLTLALLLILLLLFISIVDIGALGSFGYLVLAGTTLIILQPQLSILLLITPLLAGFLGVKRGMVLGAFSCFWAQILALLIGQSNIGLLIIGAQTGPLISLNPNPIRSIFDFSWLNGRVANGWLDVNLFSNLFSPFVKQPIFIVQIGLWTLTACVVGLFLSRSLVQKIPPRYAAIMGGSLILFAGYLAFFRLFGLGPVNLDSIILAVMTAGVLVELTSPLLSMAASMAFTSKEPYRSKGLSYKVFISYSTKDKPLVANICDLLEAAGLRCWMAPRNIGPGEDWPTSISKAIAASQVMVLVFSENSNKSEEVSRELDLAVNSQVIILPLKIDNVEPEPDKAVYLDQVHWVNAMNPPTIEQIGKLIEIINSLAIEAESRAAVMSHSTARQVTTNSVK